jgi:hypothetical protein
METYRICSLGQSFFQAMEATNCQVVARTKRSFRSPTSVFDVGNRSLDNDICYNREYDSIYFGLLQRVRPNLAADAITTYSGMATALLVHTENPDLNFPAPDSKDNFPFFRRLLPICCIFP